MFLEEGLDPLQSVFDLHIPDSSALLDPCGKTELGRTRGRSLRPRKDTKADGFFSCGKTTALKVAGSVCGGGGKYGYIRQWRATDNALEGTAATHCDNLLCLDEIGQASSRVVSEVAYMLANGQGKARANKDGNAKAIREWRLSFMSTGELTLADKIAEDGRGQVMAGQAVRVLDIPADGGTEQGIFYVYF